jgi:predicted Zn finger-like uncharacterized protein
MKFTCENCGAQYLIADTKLGDRGVKVRCKKCSYVIILRPSGWAADQKKEVKEDAPPIAAREAREKDAVAELPSFPTADVEHDLAPAPDMSLSDEFAALGFQESANVDMNSSPFESRNSGGSLDQLPGFGSDTDVLDRRLPKRSDLGSSMPQFEDDRVGDPTHVERVSMNEQIGQGPEEDTPLETEHGVGELNAALASAQRNELLDMASSLESDLEGLSSALDPRARPAKVEPPPAAPSTKSDNHRPNMQALNELASDNEGPDDPNFNFAEQIRAEREIGSAFEQMFGEVATDDGFGEPAPADKAETRVYDGDALAGVEAEQAISRPAQLPNEPAEWYVAIDDQQVGPLSISDLQEKWEAGELAADSLCWAHGRYHMLEDGCDPWIGDDQS